MLSRNNSHSRDKSWPPLQNGGARSTLPRRVPRRLLWLVAGLVGLIFLLRSQGYVGVDNAELLAVQEAAEQGLIEMLVKQKEAIEKDTTVEDLGGFADRFRVLGEMDQYREMLSSNYSQLNQSTHDLYSRSIDYHFEQLYATLFPFVSKSPKKPRTFAQLSARYTRPQGIIIPCGNDQFQFAVHLIATLKHVLYTELPISVVFAGEEDLTEQRRAALRSISPDVETINVMDFFDEEHVGLDGGGWAIKIFTLLHSEFEEVIIMDADAVFLQDPANLFDDPGYKETGTLFFRDREIFPGDGQVHDWWQSVMEGRTPSEEMEKSRFFNEQASREEMESGVVVFDKRRRAVALGLTFVGHLNTLIVREEVTYKQTYGDKESFWIAFELGGIPYHFDVPYAGIIGQLTHPDGAAFSIESRICSDHLFHLDYRGRPLWFNGSLFQEKRVKDKGFFFAQHWAPGTVDWDCEPEPWCMKSMREHDIHRLSDGGYDRILRDMIGTAMYWETQFPTLIDKHY